MGRRTRDRALWRSGRSRVVVDALAPRAGLHGGRCARRACSVRRNSLGRTWPERRSEPRLHRCRTCWQGRPERPNDADTHRFRTFFRGHGRFHRTRGADGATGRLSQREAGAVCRDSARAAQHAAGMRHRRRHRLGVPRTHRRRRLRSGAGAWLPRAPHGGARADRIRHGQLTHLLAGRTEAALRRSGRGHRADEPRQRLARGRAVRRPRLGLVGTSRIRAKLVRAHSCARIAPGIGWIARGAVVCGGPQVWGNGYSVVS